MEKFLYVQIHIMCMIILVLMICNFRDKKLSKLKLDQKLFLALICANFLNIVFDTGVWICSGIDNEVARIVNVTSTVLYYILNPFLCLVWLLYVEYKVNRHSKDVIRKIPIYSIPFLINIVITITSIWTQFSFSINEHNVYSRGAGFIVFAILSFFYLGYALLIALKEMGKKEWQLMKREIQFYVLYPILMIIIMLLQAAFYGTTLIWPVSTLLLLNIFVYVQKSEIFTDYLTGLYNRKIIGDLLELKVSKNKKGMYLFLALIDIDDFKDINDRYGHVVGDQALITIANILRNTCNDGDDLIVRLGGDEFLIAGERENLHEVEYLKNSIYQSITLENENNKHPYHLSLSIGFVILDEYTKTVSALINAADQRMYANKSIKKQSR